MVSVHLDAHEGFITYLREKLHNATNVILVVHSVWDLQIQTASVVKLTTVYTREAVCRNALLSITHMTGFAHLVIIPV